MSTSLYYRPHVDTENGIDLSYELKKAIARQYWDNDGSLNGDWIILTEEDIPYLQGISDAGIKDAKVLIEAIKKYNAVEIALIG